jgi:lipopolysaccharide export system permease protein
MNILQRYFLSHHLYFLGVCLLASIGIYLLVDVFDRLDKFLHAEVQFRYIVQYFVVKIPLIISEILPVVFLLSLLVQLGLMRRNREIVALESCGVPFARLFVFVLLIACFWSGVEFFFSEALGSIGEQKSEAIWEGRVRGKDLDRKVISDIWFRDDDYILHVGQINPVAKKGSELTVFELSPEFKSVERFISAKRFSVSKGDWTLAEAKVFNPQDFTVNKYPSKTLSIKQDLESFLVIDPRASPETLPVWQLGTYIERLKRSGSNVEQLLTIWHMKWAYPFSLVVMALIALAVSSQWENIYLNLSLGLGLTFVYYAVHVMGGAMGENGILAPWLGAWLGNMLMGGMALLRLLWIYRPVH